MNLRVERAALVGAALAFVAHLALGPMSETDLLFHLKIGDLILEQHRVPLRNLFSFTYPDHPDPDLAWGFQVLAALLHRAGGFPAIVVGKTALLVAAFALVARACRLGGAAPLPTALALALAALAAEPRMVERPHLFTFVGLGALQLLLEQRRPALVPLLTLAWANFHAGVFFSPLLLLLHRAPRPRWVLPLTVAACFASPAGLLLPGYLRWHTGLGSTRSLDEFRVADPWNDPWFFTLLVACALALLALGRRARLERLLPVLVVAPLAWRSVRFVAEWSLLAAPLVADGLGALPALRHRLIRVAVPVALVAAIALARIGRPFSLDLSDDVAPREAVAFVTANGLRERLYHDLDVGCYLLWEGWPRYRVFQDARLPAYPDEFHRALDRFDLSPAPFDALLARFSVDAALINYPGVNLRAGAFDPDEWALVYRAPDALVFARRTPRHAEVIARHEIPLRVRTTLAAGMTVEPLRAPPARSPVPPSEWRRRLAAFAFE